MKFVEVLKACEAANGGGSKQIIKEALATLDADGQRLMWYAMNPYLVFGVKKFDMPVAFAESDPADISPLFKLFDDLAARDLTGNAARGAVTTALSNFTEETAKYLARVIDKDLSAGFSDETYNLVLLASQGGGRGSFEENIKAIDKVIKGGGYQSFVGTPNYELLVPIFKVMLADKCDEVEDFDTYITFPCQADFKYDGERTIAIVNEGKINYYSRSGIEAKHVDGLFDADLLAIREELGYDFILDGERCSDLGFIDTVNAKKSGNDEAKANLRFRAFFLMPFTQWLNKKCTITMKENREQLGSLLDKLKPAKIILSEGRVVNDYADMTEFCNEAIDKPENAARKIEGLILKEFAAVYTWDRSYSWCKVKRFFDIDARIIGFYYGRKGSKYEKTIGGVNCVGFLNDGTRVEFNVGSGFNDEQRDDMRDNPDRWLKETHVIKYQEVSKSKSKAFASLRFCTYEHSRTDKLVEI